MALGHHSSAQFADLQNPVLNTNQDSINPVFGFCKFFENPAEAATGPRAAQTSALRAPNTGFQGLPETTSKRTPLATSAKAIRLEAPGCLCCPLPRPALPPLPETRAVCACGCGCQPNAWTPNGKESRMGFLDTEWPGHGMPGHLWGLRKWGTTKKAHRSHKLLAQNVNTRTPDVLGRK